MNNIFKINDIRILIFKKKTNYWKNKHNKKYYSVLEELKNLYIIKYDDENVLFCYECENITSTIYKYKCCLECYFDLYNTLSHWCPHCNSDFTDKNELTRDWLVYDYKNYGIEKKDYENKICWACYDLYIVPTLQLYYDYYHLKKALKKLTT